MIRGLTRAGIGDIGSDEDFIIKASQFGFQAVDLNPAGLVRKYGTEGTLEFLHRHHMQIGSFFLVVDWQSDEAKFQNGLQEFIESVVVASKLGLTRCSTYILPSTDQPPLRFLMSATRRLRLCADILGEYHIRLALEFVGSHHLRTAWKHPFIWRMDDTLEWMGLIGADNVGLLLDSYHWHTNGLGVNDILGLRAEQIVHVHINDAYDLPIEELLDHERIYPGEGTIHLAGFLQSLHKIGYEGVVSQEVMNSSVTTDSSILLGRSKEAFDRVFAHI